MALTGGVFVSWGAPDAARIVPLVGRLRALGIDVFEYSEDMPGGAQIHDQVMDVISDVRVAVVCFSDETANRLWVEREMTWAVQARRLGQTLQHIIPVWVGPHPDNRMPSLVEELKMAVLDVSNGAEASYERLIGDVVEKLGREAPIIVPAALYAMTETQGTELFEKWEQSEPPAGLHAVCSLLGMGDPPPLYDLLRKRYGTTPEELQPFALDEAITTTITSVVRSVNERRTQQAMSPLYLRWVHQALAEAPGDARREDARDQWLSGDSLLIVDSISALHPEVYARLQDLPEISRTAVVWLPPYSQHMAQVEPELARTVSSVGRLGDEFRRLETMPQRAMTFDAGTPLAVRLWLRRTLASFSDQPAPQPDLVGSVRGERAGRRLNGLLGSRF